MMILRSKKGFTLIEIVVAVTLLIILLTTLSFIFTSGLGLYQRFGTGISTFNEARRVFQQIETDLLSVIEGNGLFRGGDSPVRMDFVTKNFLGEDSILAVRYQYDAAGERIQRFFVPTDSLNLPADISADSDEVGINITNFTLAFYSNSSSGLLLNSESSAWSATELPVAVRVEMTVRDEKDPDLTEDFIRLFVIRNQNP